MQTVMDVARQVIGKTIFLINLRKGTTGHTFGKVVFNFHSDCGADTRRSEHHHGDESSTAQNQSRMIAAPTRAEVNTITAMRARPRKIKAEQIATAEQRRKLFEKQKAEREANGDFFQAPGLTPAQREASEIRSAEKSAEESFKGAKLAPQ